MSVKHRKKSTNDNVQQDQTAIMEDTVVTMESATILMGGPTTNDLNASQVRIKKVKAK